MDVKNLINTTVVNSEPMFSTYIHSKAYSAGLPASATFELTARCNFNCKMCYVHNQDSAACLSTEKPAEWWIDLGKKAADIGVIFLLLTGGEPLLRDDFAHIYTELSKLGFVISINTNGYLITDEILALFKKNPPTRINISLYGASNETYNNVTETPAFSRVIDNVKKLIDMGIDIRFNGTFTSLNACDIERIFNISRELGVLIKGTTYIFPQVLVGKKPGENPCRLSPRRAAENRLSWLKLLYSPEEYKKRIKETIDGVDASVYPVMMNVVRVELSAVQVEAAFWVNSKGEMCFCGVAGHPFSIDEYGFEGAWEKVKEFSASIRTPAKCEACKYKSICCVCAAACYTETGSFSEVPEYVCQFTELTAQLMKSEAERLEDNNGN